MFRLTTVILFIIICSSKASGQSIYGIWTSDTTKSCIEFDSLTGRMNIGDFYDDYNKVEPSLQYKQKFVFKIKNDKLKIVWTHGQNSFGTWIPKTYWLWIEKFTQDELWLSFLPKNDGSLYELFGGARVLLRRNESCKNCREYYTFLLGKK